ncbi:valine--tRNA ligase [Orbilia oligospora]|uniref:valine--tRNA ligase n=1 Tax=Orbilia oligospora TaxID=2813651 RepID=A0A7C8UTX8_ORBOL|nr:valine--tRNA ligase [Orbilia oligospora]
MATNQDPSLSSRRDLYQPSEVEGKWYGIWEKEGYFKSRWPRPQHPLSSRLSGESWSNLSTSEAALSNAQKQSVDSSLETIERSTASRGRQNLRPLIIPASINGTLSTTTSEASQLDERGLEFSEISAMVFGDGSVQNQSDTNPSTSPSLANVEEASKSASFDDRSKKCFTMFTLPLSITGDLHCGHALAISLEDALVRYHRMQGFKTLFLPGSDHAGVSVQCIVEKKLFREKGKDRHQIGRPRFTKHLNEWKDEYRGRISSTVRRLGASVDWTREAFTMDETRKKAATEAFVQLYEQGVIYRGSHIVHWCPTLRTAVSEHEIGTLEINGPTRIKIPGYAEEIEFGVLYHYKYVIVKDDNTPRWIELATTRPELLLADSGIAVHPGDERYVRLIGMSARHPYSGRLLPIVGDFTVNPKFGTGAISVAPGHSERACEIGRRSKLQSVVVFREDGTVNEAGDLWKGQQRFELRQTIIENLEDRGLLLKREPCKETLQICNRSGDVVELMSKSQWWVRMDDLAGEAAEAVREGRIKIRPESVEKEYLNWLDEPKDWCISRNIWWGQQIPAWFLSLKEEERNALKPDESDPKRWIVARSEEEARKKGELAFPDMPFRLTRDEAVLDACFGAATWPLSTLGWPEGGEFREFYPTTMFDTGPDTLPSWVTRMVAVSLKLTGEAPFGEVLFHPLVKDQEGRKMSKSLGNVIDPVDFITGCTLEALNQKQLKGSLAPSSEELDKTKQFQATCFPDGIPECGADALRFALVDSTSESQTILLDARSVIKCREFCDGLYETVQGALRMLPGDYKPMKSAYGQRMAQGIGDRYILHRLNTASRDVEGAMEEKRFWEATRGIKNLWCHHIPTYLKCYHSYEEDDTDPDRLSAAETLYAVIDGALRLTHPFMPFITEELWQKLPKYPHDDTPSIMLAEFPKRSPEFEYPYAEEEFTLIMNCAKEIQLLCQENGYPGMSKVYIKSRCFMSQQTLEKHTAELQQQSGVTNIKFLRSGDEAPSGSIASPLSEDISIYLSDGNRPDSRDDISELQLKLKTAQRKVLRQENKLRESALRDLIDERDRKVEESRLEVYKARVKNYEKVISDLSNSQA